MCLLLMVKYLKRINTWTLCPLCPQNVIVLSYISLVNK